MGGRDSYPLACRCGAGSHGLGVAELLAAGLQVVEALLEVVVLGGVLVRGVLAVGHGAVAEVDVQ